MMAGATSRRDLDAFDLVRADHVLPLDEGGRSWLGLRERRPAGGVRGAVLMVHGATLPASTLFDGPPPGRSWLDDLARGGFQAFALDLPGYGRSSRPEVLRRSPHENAPVVRAAEAVASIDRAMAFIQDQTGRERVDVVGGSWGSVTCGLYASTIGRERVRRLVLYAPLFSARNAGWLSWIEDPARPGRLHPALGAYRLVTAADNRRRWDAELAAAGDPGLLDPEVFDGLMRSFLASDPDALTRDPPAVAVPNGTLVDLLEVFGERPLYAPEAITAPTLLIRGADDPTSTQADMMGLLDRLGCAVKRAVTIGRGTHFVSAERNGWQVFEEVRGFLGTPEDRGGLARFP